MGLPSGFPGWVWFGGTMKIQALVILGACALLTACGGSNDGVISTPPPPPPPAAPFPLVTSASFQTITGTLSYTGEAQEGFSGAGNAVLSTQAIAGRSSNVTFGYDASSGTYTVQESGAPIAFTASNAIAAADYRKVYGVTQGSVSDAIALYGNVQASTVSAPVELSYTSYGLWIHTDNGAVQTTNTYFLYGQATGAANMPTTGTATYDMVVAARMLETQGVPSRISTLSGTATLTANFGSGTVDTMLSFRGGSTYNGTGPIAGDQFSGTFASSTDPFFVRGGYAGGFFGPGAKEAGYTFQIVKYNPDPYAGAAVSAVNSYVTGVAVGAKK